MQFHCGETTGWATLHHSVTPFRPEHPQHTHRLFFIPPRDAELSLLPTRSAPSSSLSTDTRTPISICASLRPSLCRKTPTVSSSCSLSGLLFLITSSETQACDQPPSTTSAAMAGVFHLIPFMSFSSDRGNDNWLLKYDCPMDSVGSKVRTLLIKRSFSRILTPRVSLFHLVILHLCRTRSGWWLRIPSSNWQP